MSRFDSAPSDWEPRSLVVLLFGPGFRSITDVFKHLVERQVMLVAKETSTLEIHQAAVHCHRNDSGPDESTSAIQ